MSRHKSPATFYNKYVVAQLLWPARAVPERGRGRGRGRNEIVGLLYETTRYCFTLP
jgi:hypothetical protein